MNMWGLSNLLNYSGNQKAKLFCRVGLVEAKAFMTCMMLLITFGAVLYEVYTKNESLLLFIAFCCVKQIDIVCFISASVQRNKPFITVCIGIWVLRVIVLLCNLTFLAVKARFSAESESQFLNYHTLHLILLLNIWIMVLSYKGSQFMVEKNSSMPLYEPADEISFVGIIEY